MRLLRNVIAAAAAAAASSPASADVVSAGLALASWLAQGYAYGTALVVAVASIAYGSASARRSQRRAQAEARAAYNASLSERSVTALRAAPPWRICYGTAEFGGDIVAAFFTDKTGTRDDGSTYTRPDALKHLVIHWTTHQSNAALGLKIDGKSVGTLDGSGYATSSDFVRTRTVHRVITLLAGASVTLPSAITVITANGPNGGFGYYGSIPPITYTLTNSDKTLTNTSATETGTFSVTFQESLASVRAFHHLGSDTQTVDTYLNGLLPTKWTANHRLRGITYSVVTLDLEDPQFQAGLPRFTIELEGRILLDSRTSTQVFSSNNALCLADFLTAPWGPKCDRSEVDDANYTNPSANSCDELITETWIVGGAPVTYTNRKRFTFNGVITTDMAIESVLDQFADSMAGWCVYGAKWQIMAGVWNAPVKDLTDNDLDGAIEHLQSATPVESLFNGVRGQFIPAGTSTPIDFTPYKNATFVTDDGKPLWKDMTLPFTSNPFTATSIARIITERSRNGLVIKFPGKAHLLGLRVGQRVRITSPLDGWTLKTFRITDWQYQPFSAPVMLTCQEDSAAAYDEADETVADPTPNTDNPSPWILPAVSLNTPLSDATTLRLTSDGAVVPRVKVSWAAYTGPYVADGSGYIYVKWHRVLRDNPNFWNTIQLPGNEVEFFIEGMGATDIITIGVWAENNVGGKSDVAWAAVTAAGKAATPTAISGHACTPVPGAAVITWTPSQDVDYAATEWRVGASWAAGTRIFRGASNKFDWNGATTVAQTIRGKNFDTSGNESSEVTLSAFAQSLQPEANADFDNGSDGWTGITGTGTASDASAGKYGLLNLTGSLAYPRKLPVSTEHVYRARFRAKILSGSAVNVYAGVMCFDSAGAPFSSTAGGANSHPYCAAEGAGLPADGQWHTFEGNITGKQPTSSNPTDLNKFFAGAAFAAPIFFTSAATSTQVAVDFCVLQDITTDWGGMVGGTGRPADSATADAVLVGRGVAVTGNSAVKTDNTNAWDSDVYSLDSFTGGAFASAVAGQANKDLMFGLNSDPTTDRNFTGLDFAFYCEGAGVLLAYESGSGTNVGTYTATDVLAVIYDGFRVRWMKNGVVLRTVNAGVGLNLFFDSSFYGTSARLTNMRFGPLSEMAGITSAQISSVNADTINAGAIRGINVTAASHLTKGSYLTAATSGGATTVNVKDTTDFASSGAGVIIDTTNDRDAFSWTGKTATTLTGCSGVLVHNNGATIIPLGKAMVIDAATNEMRFYGDRGDGTIEELASIGIVSSGSDFAVAVFGTLSSGSTRAGVIGYSRASSAVAGVTDIGRAGEFRSLSGGIAALLGENQSSGPGVEGTSDTGNGGSFFGNETKGNLRLFPLAGRPSNRQEGQLAMIYTTGGSTDARTATPKAMQTDGTDWRLVEDNSIWNG